MRLPCGLLRTASYWWTGEDSNLRSPQGAADLQSAGFSHSPTRPRKINGTKTRSEKQLGREKKSPAQSIQQLAMLRRETQKGLVSKDTSPFNFTSRIRSASLRYPTNLSGAGGGN
jgi:hypothetical protein